MALAYVIRDTLNLGSVQGKLIEITLDAAYPAGGYDINADKTKLGFIIISAVIPLGMPRTVGVAPSWDRVNKKLKYFRFDYPNTAAGAAIEAVAGNIAATDKQEVLILGV